MTFRTLRLGRFRGSIQHNIPKDWLASILSEPLESQSGRVCYRPLPEALGSGEAAVKIYRVNKKRRLLKRMKVGRARREGEGYLCFHARGIQTVDLLLFAEERHLGLLTSGVVVTRKVDAETVAQSHTRNPRFELLEQTADTLSHIHLAGLAHGDPRTRNFLATKSGPLPFDLPSWSFLTAVSQRQDLVRFLGSTAALLGGVMGTRPLAARYRSHGLRLPCTEDELMDEVSAYHRKKDES
jgi:hypothetical protein